MYIHHRGCALTILLVASLPLTAKTALSQSSAGGNVSGTTLEEIVVTARKRNESLENVPISISALSAADQQNLVLGGMADYLRQVPGTLLVSGGPDYLSDIAIRGQGGGRNGFSESATGIYRNGIFVAGGGFGGRSFNRLDYFDNASVDIYRGPQGALYGRNAVGGAVNVISNRPQMSTGGSVKAEYGSAEKTRVEGIFNGVIAEDKIAVRLGGFELDQRGGDITDVNTGKKLDAQNYQGARAQLRVNLSDLWQTRLTYEDFSSEGAGFSALGRRLATGLPAGRVFDPDIYLRNASRVGRVKIDDQTVYFEIEGTTGIGDFSAVYVRKSREGRRFNEDLDHFLGLEGLPGVDMIANQSENFDRQGIEVRLASGTEERLSWLVGGDWQGTKSDVLTFNGGTVPSTSAAALRAQAVRRDSALEKLNSWSAFATLDYALTPQLNSALEVRYQRDHKKFRFQRIDLVTGPVQLSNPGWRKTLPGASLQYKLNDTINLYARYSTGLRAGGFNQGVSNLALLEYDPESAKGYEIGIKGRIPDWRMRFGLSAYYTDNDNLQVVTTASTADTTFTLVNLPGAAFWGAEAELSGLWSVGTGRLTYNLGVATQDGRFDAGSQIFTTGRVIDISRAEVNRARDLTLNLSAFYAYPLSRNIDLVVGGSYREEKGGNENATGGTADVTGRKLENYAMYDARASLRGSWWLLSAYGKNLSEKIFSIQQNINGNNYYNEGKRYGLEVSLKFGGEKI